MTILKQRKVLVVNIGDGQNQKTYWLGAGQAAVSASGGGWYTNVYASQSFEYGSEDMRMDVTPIMNKWLDGTYPNHGFIIKRSGSFGNTDTNTDEGSQDRLGNFKFFSRQTNTIYPPKLEVEWYDTKFNTGSLSALIFNRFGGYVRVYEKFKTRIQRKF